MMKNQIKFGISQWFSSNLLRCALPVGLALMPLAGCGSDGVNDATSEAQSELLPSGPIRISYGSDPLQFGDLRLPGGHGRAPVAVIIHGGCWSNLIGYDFMNDMATALTNDGIATWNIEYRRTGDVGGGYPNTLTDVGQAVDKLRELAGRYRIDLNNVVTVGHSSGGQLGSWVAARRHFAPNDPLRGTNPLRLAAAVPLAGIFDLPAYVGVNACGDNLIPLMGGTPAQLPDLYAHASPIDLLPIGVRQTIIHGTADDIVPISQSEQFKAAACQAGDPVTLKEISGATHFDMISPTSPKWPEIEQYILAAVHAGDGHPGNGY